MTEAGRNNVPFLFFVVQNCNYMKLIFILISNLITLSVFKDALQ